MFARFSCTPVSAAHTGSCHHYYQMLVTCVLLTLVSQAGRAAARGTEEASSSPLATTIQVLDLSSPALFPSIGFATLPANVDASPVLVPVLREMWARSPTFRHQCARIARATGGRVKIAIRTQRSSKFRAMSMIHREKAGAWLASVEVFVDSELVQMLAHEFEHVIEQIDGVDLPRLEQQGLAGVVAGSEHYETARAVATGQRVAWEFLHRNTQARAAETPMPPAAQTSTVHAIAAAEPPRRTTS
jgi:hypothetical protein